MSFNFEKEALISSGVKDPAQIKDYIDKLDLIYENAFLKMKGVSDPISKARFLFNWLWMKKPLRYKSGGNYRLNEVIDAQLNEHTDEVGNCLGLTLLYNCLLGKIGLKACALYLENAFEVGPHILTVLETDRAKLEIENILPNGFGYMGHKNNRLRVLWEDKELISDIHHSAGNEFFEKRAFEKALSNYDVAIALNPEYEKAHINRAILIDKMRAEKN